MNYRIRKNGGKIYLSDNIRFTYYCRDTVSGIMKMARLNGMWNVITMKLCPGSLGIRHFVPLAFVLSVLGFVLLGFVNKFFWGVLGIELLLYLTLDALFSSKNAESLHEFALMMFLFFAFHVSYGCGSLLGIFKLFKSKYRDNRYEPRKI